MQTGFLSGVPEPYWYISRICASVPRGSIVYEPKLELVKVKMPYEYITQIWDSQKQVLYSKSWLLFLHTTSKNGHIFRIFP